MSIRLKNPYTNEIIVLEEYTNTTPCNSRYAPWNKDVAFWNVMLSIKDYTIVDQWRCYELWSLIADVAKFDRGALIEIGTYRGGSGALIAHKAKQCGLQENVYLCDTFTGLPKASLKDNFHKNGDFEDTSLELVKDFIYNQQKLDNVKILQGIFPDETSHLIEDDYFRFIHIDVDVYESAKGINNLLWDKLIIGGVVVYDDFGSQTAQGIKDFVEEQMPLKDRITIYNLNNHAVVIKIA